MTKIKFSRNHWLDQLEKIKQEIREKYKVPDIYTLDNLSLEDLKKLKERIQSSHN